MNMLAKSTDKIQTIHNFYPALAVELKRTGAQNLDSSSGVYEHEVNTLLDALAASGRPSDLQRIENILADMPQVFLVNPTSETHTIIIRALIQRGNTDTVLRWFRAMQDKPPFITPTLEQYHIFLEACTDLSSFKFMRNLVLSMRKTGCKPTTETFKILIRALWAMSPEHEHLHPHVVAFSALVDDMKKEELPYDDAIAKMLYDGYASRGLTAQAEEVLAVYKSRLSDSLPPPQQLEISWTPQLSEAARKEGVAGALVVYEQYSAAGGVPSHEIFKAILRHSQSIDDLDQVQTALGMSPTAVHWSLLISNNIRMNKLLLATTIYEETKRRGVVPDAALVGPLIKGLCRTSSGPPTDNYLDQALGIYHDLAAAAPPSSTPSKESYYEHSVGPDTEIYQSLIRGLSSSPNSRKYLPIAQSLLNDMVSRNISVNNVTCSMIIILMRNAPDDATAFDAYRNLHSGLDGPGYIHVLDAFCRLSFDGSLYIPSLSLYFDIVRDMRQAGYPVTASVYTTLLRQIGTLGTWAIKSGSSSSPEFIDQLTTVTRRVHDLLTLDASISPDAHLWNQLLNTYQRLGCFADACRVWDQMYLSGRFDHVSVSLILDACGFAGSWHIAQQTCARLFRDKFRFSLHNWNSWVECLCRLGRMNDAVKVVCLEMGNGQVSPDVETVRVLVSFARKTNLQRQVLGRIQQYLPELWETLPTDLKD